jgi:predicted nucleotidyltransferase
MSDREKHIAPFLAGAPPQAEASKLATALEAFRAGVEVLFPAHPPALYLVGSRARGDHRSDSDVDVAVVFPDRDWAPHARLETLSGLAFDILLDHGLHIQPHPFAAAEWAEGATPLIRSMTQDAREVRP